MSRTVRRHESESKRKRRGPKNQPDEDAPKARLKSHKQERPNKRAKLRKEYL
jgi:hypothetical protein